MGIARNRLIGVGPNFSMRRCVSAPSVALMRRDRRHGGRNRHRARPGLPRCSEQGRTPPGGPGAQQLPARPPAAARGRTRSTGHGGPAEGRHRLLLVDRRARRLHEPCDGSGAPLAPLRRRPRCHRRTSCTPADQMPHSRRCDGARWPIGAPRARPRVRRHSTRRREGVRAAHRCTSCTPAGPARDARDDGHGESATRATSWRRSLRRSGASAAQGAR